jgi:polyferredoxin
MGHQGGTVSVQESKIPAETEGSGRALGHQAEQHRSRALRWWGLLALLVAVTGFGIMHQYGGIRVVGVDALCPFGGIETLWSLASSATLVKQIAVSSVILLGIVLILAVVFRRTFCGQICPLGALQELAGKLGAVLRKGKARLVVPASVDRFARYLKYAVLAFFTIWTWQAAELVIRPYDPWVAWMHLSTTEVWAEFGIGIAVLAVSIVGSVVYDRFFCKYLCPMGATLGLISRLSVFKVRRNADTCIDCGKCDKACPMNVSVSTVETVESAECINCNECVNACPVKDTLQVATRNRGRVISATTMWLATLGIVLTLVVAASVSGAFAWTIPTLTETTQQSGGVFDVENIKGSMSFEEISAATGIAGEVFKTKWNLSESDMAVPIKDIAGTYGFDVHTDVREFVATQLAASGK